MPSEAASLAHGPHALKAVAAGSHVPRVVQAAPAVA